VTPLVRLHDVTVAYEGPDGPRALLEFNLDIAGGDVVSLIGPSGAGKTTVLNLINGLVTPTTGTVDVLGTSTSEFGHRKHRGVRQRIATIHQSFALVGPLSVARNVANGQAGRWSTIETIRQGLRPRELHDIAQVLHQVGIGDKLWARVDELSGGQRQRVAIARALHQNGDVIVADEPVSSLDPARADQVMGVLASTAIIGEGAVVASMHDAPLALAHSTRIIGLRDGRLVFDSAPTDVTEAQLTSLYELDDGVSNPETSATHHTR